MYMQLGWNFAVYKTCSISLLYEFARVKIDPFLENEAGIVAYCY